MKAEEQDTKKYEKLKSSYDEHPIRVERGIKVFPHSFGDSLAPLLSSEKNCTNISFERHRICVPCYPAYLLSKDYHFYDEYYCKHFFKNKSSFENIQDYENSLQVNFRTKLLEKIAEELRARELHAKRYIFEPDCKHKMWVWLSEK